MKLPNPGICHYGELLYTALIWHMQLTKLPLTNVAVENTSRMLKVRPKSLTLPIQNNIRLRQILKEHIAQVTNACACIKMV